MKAYRGRVSGRACRGGLWAAVLVAWSLAGVGAGAEDRIAVVELEGAVADPVQRWARRADLAPEWLRIEGAEVLPMAPDWSSRAAGAQERFLVRLPAGSDPAALEASVLEAGGTARARRTLSATLLEPNDETARRWATAAAYHYGEMMERQVPGGALFRARFDAAMASLPEEDRTTIGLEVENQRWRWGRRRFDRNDSFDLLSGGRALQENLQLDLVLAPADAGAPLTVELSSLEAVTVAAIDWAPYLADAGTPDLDALAAYLPEDNLSVFFPSFASLVAVVDTGERLGNPVADVVATRATSEATRRRVETQLTVSLDGVARALGGQAIGEVAASADDPYVLDGTGLALLFRARNATMLRAFLAAAHEAARQADPDVRAVSGSFGDVAWSGVVNRTRTVSSYVMALEGDVVVVGNSLALLERIVRTRAGDEASLAGLDEYRFFRARYPRGAEHEDAFCLMTDAAIRKWTGPRWRIGQSRRVRAAAALSDLAARHADELLAATTEGGTARTYPTAWVFTGPTEVTRLRHGFHHHAYGSLAFLTPIAELDLDRVTEEEAASYNGFRNSYQRRWTRFFDPIAIQTRARGGLELDVTVMPLIAGSDYRNLIELTGTGRLDPRAGDPHDGVLAHVIFHLDPNGRDVVRLQSALAGSMEQAAMPMRWMSGSLEVYFDDDPFWSDAARQGERAFERWIGDNWMRMPVAVRIGSNNPLGLAAFLTAIRTLADGTAPGMLTWETMQHGEAGFVRVTARDPGGVEPSFYYASERGGLTLSLREEVIRRVLDRTAARGRGEATGGGEWLGGSVAARLDARAAGRIINLLDRPLDRAARTSSYANLPILNEWRRLYPDRDPVEVHRTVFGTTLECPGGQGYRWNADLLTMESVALGSPGDERGEAVAHVLPSVATVETGVTFEPDGLRARLKLTEGGEEGAR